MSHPNHLRRAGLAAAIGIAFATVPATALAAPVDLGTAAPFVVLGGSAVTNTGPSVLNGALGVAPGTALSGFPPGIVNGATHVNDAVASQAQADLTTAYNVAAGEPVSPGNDLTGTDLGNRTLTAGAYRYATSAGLTGPLTLDAQGDPNALFVFEIGSTLTTASASSVLLVNGASPCNVFWQVGSSATLGTGTAFQGSLMALTSATLNTGAGVHGRVLARNGSVTLDTNALDLPACATPTSTPTPTPTPDSTPTPSPTGGPVGGPAGPSDQAPPGSRSTVPTRNGSATLRATSGESSRAGQSGTGTFSATVRGRNIRRVVFSVDGRRVPSRNGSPLRVRVHSTPGEHRLTARVTFRDSTRAKTLRLRYRVRAGKLLQPRRGPSQFTG